MIEENKNVEQKTKESNLNTSNIFEDFDENRDNDSSENNIKKPRELFDYMIIIGNIFKYINFVLFFIVFIGFTYIYIQNSDSETFNNKDYLVPICNIFSGNNDISLLQGNNCSSITNLNKLVLFKLNARKEDQFKKIIPVLYKQYTLNNIFESPKSTFVLDKTKNKFNPLEIINEFDLLKNKFTGDDVNRIRCDGLKVDNNIISTKCYAYSKDWDPFIPGLKGETSFSNSLKGTSITLAASFLNFLKQSNSFKLLNEQKTFDTKPYFGDGPYSYITSFKVDAEYKEKQNNNLN